MDPTLFPLQAFTYDANGNRSSITENGTLYSYTNQSNSNRLLSTTGPTAKTNTHDAAGNITNDGTHTFVYDDWNRLVDVDAGSATYAHNGQGQRVKKDNGTVTLFAYDEVGRLVGEYDSAGNAAQEHVWFNGAPVAVLAGTAKHYVHTDQLGTPRAITDGTTVIWRWESDPFGTTAAQDDPDGDTNLLVYGLRFPGQYYDAETGLHYNYFRTYDPSIGRYIESDSIGLGGGLNTYGYVVQNPLQFVDPTGEAPIIPVIITFCELNPYACAAAAAGIYYAADQAARGLFGVLSNIHIGPWPGSTTRPDPFDAGEEAADEVLGDLGGSCDTSDPESCKEAARLCKRKCINKAIDGYGGSMDQFILRCQQACTGKLGCGNFFP